MIRSEQFHAAHPYRTYVGWGLFYIVVMLAVATWFIQFANSMHTYSVPVGAVSLKVPYAKYLSGEAITFSVTNNYNTTVTIANNCPNEPLAVYRQVNKKWRRVHATAKASSCKDKARSINIAPGKTVSGSYKAWPNLFKKPGNYRIAVFVEYFGSVTYQDLTVIKKPKPATAKKTPTTPERIAIPSPTTPTQTSNNDDNEEEDEDEDNQPSSGGSRKSASITVPNGGTVNVQYDASIVYVMSISTSCPYEGGGSGREVEITFKCGGDETQLQLWVSGGQLRQKIERED